MRGLFSEHKGFWTERHKHSLYLAIVLIILSLIIQIGAGRYSARRAISANSVGDIFLDNLPLVNLDFMIVQVALIFWVGCIFLMVVRPKYLLFGLKATALFVVFRSFFLSLTHVGIYPNDISLNPGGDIDRFLNLFSFPGNYFFSGHTGFPFLMTLIFWKEKLWRRFFGLATIVFAATMLLAHAHYSIDVFAAPFITYGIFKITEYLFPFDRALKDGVALHT